MKWPWSKPKSAYHCEQFGTTCNPDCDNCEQLKEWEAQQAKYKQEPSCAYPQFASLQSLRMVPSGYVLTYADTTSVRRSYVTEKPIEITPELVYQMKSGGKIDGLRELSSGQTPPQTQEIPQVFLDMDK